MTIPSLTYTRAWVRVFARAFVLSVVLVLVFTPSTPAHAQPTWRYSIQVGPAVTTLQGDGAGDARSLVGFSLNGTVGLRLFGPLYAQTGLRFVRKGFAYDNEDLAPGVIFGDDDPEDATAELRTGFVQIPLLLRAYLPDVGPVRPSLFVGPAFGLSSTDRLSREEGEVTVTSDVDVFEGTEVSGLAGIGVSFVVPYVERIIIEGQFERGLTDATKLRFVPEGDDPSFATRTQALIFTVGVVL